MVDFGGSVFVLRIWVLDRGFGGGEETVEMKHIKFYITHWYYRRVGSAFAILLTILAMEIYLVVR